VIAARARLALGLGYSLSQSCAGRRRAGPKVPDPRVQRGSPAASTGWPTWSGRAPLANEVGAHRTDVQAEEALQHGMVNRVVPAEDLIRPPRRWPPRSWRTRRSRSGPTCGHCGGSSTRCSGSPLYTQGLGLHLSEDFQESAAPFVEKRKPSSRAVAAYFANWRVPPAQGGAEALLFADLVESRPDLGPRRIHRRQDVEPRLLMAGNPAASAPRLTASLVRRGPREMSAISRANVSVGRGELAAARPDSPSRTEAPS